MGNNIKDKIQESLGNILVSELDEDLQYKVIKMFKLNNETDNAIFLMKEGHLIILTDLKETPYHLDKDFNVDPNGERTVTSFKDVIVIGESPITGLLIEAIRNN